MKYSGLKKQEGGSIIKSHKPPAINAEDGRISQKECVRDALTDRTRLRMRKLSIRLYISVPLLALSGACGSAIGAEIASLERVGGNVLVSRGQGFAPISGQNGLNPGDLVLAMSGGTASIRYGAGCSVAVRSGAVVAVAAASPCPQQAGAPVAAGSTLITSSIMRLNPPGAGAQQGPTNSDISAEKNGPAERKEAGVNQGSPEGPAGEVGGDVPGGFFSNPLVVAGAVGAAVGVGVLVRQLTAASKPASP